MLDPYGLPAASLAEACGVDVSTARKWKKRGAVPPRYARLIALAFGADLGAITLTWSAWSLRDGRLTSPEGDAYSPGEVRSIGLRLQQLAELERQLRRVLERTPASEPLTVRIAVEIDPERTGARVRLLEV